MEFQPPSSTHFGLREFQSCRRPGFCFFTLYKLQRYRWFEFIYFWQKRQLWLFLVSETMSLLHGGAKSEWLSSLCEANSALLPSLCGANFQTLLCTWKGALHTLLHTWSGEIVAETIQNVKRPILPFKKINLNQF